ncbi:GntR family transcriptional regulator [Aliirhizobium smilacinae]|uniref:GntR family transcriptional regulator n=1 Tax=Aliirhizobium smilacinae TaxID=1395944 RepID=A0A5C4X8X6_9HYPH|nr:GntR family transcriptional regulator [Rhizobium smilacinae]TNM59903.1 GntR family transcriptional regulator [Rhizobium smilacinae]
MHQPKLGPTERVYLQLKNDITLQNFSFNERLVVNELAERYTVSTTPVREALSRLHGEDLINFRYGHGYFCKTPTLRELRELYELLTVIVASSLKKCNVSGSDARHVRELASMVAGQLENNDDKRQWVVHLTEEVVLVGGNQISLNLVKNIHARTYFISKRAFIDDCSSTDLIRIVDHLQQSIRSHDLRSQESDLLNYHDVMRNSLPTLLVNHVGAQYIAQA